MITIKASNDLHASPPIFNNSSYAVRYTYVKHDIVYCAIRGALSKKRQKRGEREGRERKHKLAINDG